MLRLREEFGPYPLARARPLLDVSGRELIRRVQDEVGLDRELSLVVVRNDQVILDLPVRHFTESVDYDRGVAIALRPATITPDVRMDPRRAFGQPAVEGVRTEVLAQDYRAGESREALAELYGLTVDQVDQALRFELIAAAPPAA